MQKQNFFWPERQGSCWGPIERTAWLDLSFRRFPTFTHWFHGSGWYSSTWCVQETGAQALLNYDYPKKWSVLQFKSHCHDCQWAEKDASFCKKHVFSIIILHLISCNCSVQASWHPEPSSQDGTPWSIFHCNRKVGNGKPGLCPKREHQHRTQVPITQSSSNNKCLHKKKVIFVSPQQRWKKRQAWQARLCYFFPQLC